MKVLFLIIVIALVVSLVDHVFPAGADEVKITEPPLQKVVGPPGVIIGVAGGAFTVTIVPALVEVQVPLDTVTV